MTWKQRMQVPVSQAELDVFIELQRRGLTDHLETNKGFEFNPEQDRVHGTVPDLYYNHPYRYAVFLDGEKVHRGNRLDKDELITKALERRGIRVDRFRYRVPLPKYRKMEICDKIEGALNSLGYGKEA